MVVPNTEAGRLWMYEQRLLELHSVWVGINTLLAFGQWTSRFELSLSKFHLAWKKLPPFLPPLLIAKPIYSFFSAGLFSACGPQAHCFCQRHRGYSLSWASVHPVGEEVVAQAPLLSSWILRKAELCVFHSTLVKSPRAISILPPVGCSSLGRAEVTLIWQNALQLMCRECASSCGGSLAAGARFLRPLLNYRHQRLRAISFYSPWAFFVWACMQGCSWKGQK